MDESEALEPFWNRVGGAAIGWCAGLLGVLDLAWGIGQRLRRPRADADARRESRVRTLSELASHRPRRRSGLKAGASGAPPKA